MQGLNPITMQCTYITPCGWCTKWDKKCDKKISCDHTPNQPKADNSLSLKDTRCYFCLTRYVCGEEYEFECQKNDFCHFSPDTEATLEVKRPARFTTRIEGEPI